MIMKNEQLQSIYNYLDHKGLIQVDLRMEVLDHMIVSIENEMEQGCSFSDAFKQECEKWNPLLKPHSSAWLGLIFTGPKLMMQKCVRMVKRLYLKTLVLALLISGALWGMTDILNLTPQNTRIDNFIGFGLLMVSAILLYTYYTISKNKVKTTYGYFIKIHTIGIVLNLAIFNPFISNNFGFSAIESFSFSKIIVYTFLVTHAVLFINMYTKHREFINCKLAT